MGHLPALINDLALILVLAGIVTLLFKRLKQPLILGYIIVGFIAGPHIAFTPSVADESNVSTWADIGVIFLMFTLGLEFSFKKILKMGSAPFIAACTIIFCMIGLGSICGHFFGWSRINSLFLGGMLAMSSTTVIYKALTDMGYMQHRFASSVMSVLVIEDILGILLMVVLSTIAMSNSFQGIQLAGSLLQLALVLVVWFVVGVFIIPTFLSKARPLMSSETLLIVSLGLCFLMVVLAVKLHYSSAFGAFMAGSILAETIEAEDITKVVQPVKDLFGAIFFVSVGMLVDPQIIVQYWFPILVLILAILVGQAVFGTFDYLLSGQPLKVAMQCGFSMAQIGEFAFIIASLGNSLHVTAHFLYPVVVAVSVITTFLTPYMIRLAGPAYGFVEKHLPGSLKHTLNQTSGIPSVNSENAWKRLLRALFKQVIAYAVTGLAISSAALSRSWPSPPSCAPSSCARTIATTSVSSGTSAISIAFPCSLPYLCAMSSHRASSFTSSTISPPTPRSSIGLSPLPSSCSLWPPSVSSKVASPSSTVSCVILTHASYLRRKKASHGPNMLRGCSSAMYTSPCSPCL